VRHKRLRCSKLKNHVYYRHLRRRLEQKHHSLEAKMRYRHIDNIKAAICENPGNIC
jgi:hypothetical protein